MEKKKNSKIRNESRDSTTTSTEIKRIIRQHIRSLRKQRSINMLFFYKCLKMPPTINQFTWALDHQTATQLLNLAHKYKPETKQEKERLLTWGEKKVVSQGSIPTKRLPVLQAGLNTVTILVENKKAQLVVIAHDVDPTELLSSCLPCVRASGPWEDQHHCPAFTQINSEDTGSLAKLKYDEICCHWRGNILGPNSVICIAKTEKTKAKELATKLG
ncbi:unnamed protein product [Nyctereutes procyonoides]|uniref:60S ribosomal protein L7a n=1 Tax=Nyctereutes procyonoides TaxID=34880 RepID=A0A811YQG1_NYCPR|nr:unnamed protein product [Nyctereutes procyonoides]